MRDVELPGPAHREAAWKAVRRFLAVTPGRGRPPAGPSVSVKVETVQPTGSFKVRGGLAAVSATLEQDPGRAVVASSAGNHGLGLAYAASKLGATVTVVVPTGASAAKVSALQQFDVRLVLHGEGYREAETHALELAARDGSRYVSPYNDPDVIAGQATLARELVEQVPELGTVVVPCGGGGLLAGVILGLEGTGVRVVGVESEASPSMSTALAAGAIVPIEVEPTVADGLAGNLEPGAVTVGVALDHGVDVLTVSEADIRSAMAFSASKMGLVLEGAGAVGVAALRAGVVTPDAEGQGDGRAVDRAQRGAEAPLGGAPFLKSAPTAPRSITRSPVTASRSCSSPAAASPPSPGTCRWCRPSWPPGTASPPSTTGAWSRPPRHRRPTASTAWRPTPSRCSTISGGSSRCASPGTPWVAGSPRRWCSTSPDGSGPPR